MKPHNANEMRQRMASISIQTGNEVYFDVSNEFDADDELRIDAGGTIIYLPRASAKQLHEVVGRALGDAPKIATEKENTDLSGVADALLKIAEAIKGNKPPTSVEVNHEFKNLPLDQRI